MPTAVYPHRETSAVPPSSTIYIVLAKFDCADSILLPKSYHFRTRISALSNRTAQHYILASHYPEAKTGSLSFDSHETMENFEKSPSIFAVMVPANNAARASFSQVAQKMLEDKDWNPTARQNIQANADSIQVSHDSSVSESDGGNATPKTSSPVSVGCYTFDFVKPPEEPGNGWLIGGGKFSESDLRPEILLTERRKHDRVSSRHARLSHNFKSGALLISASENSAVLVDGYRLINGHRVIHGITTSLEFGELSYTLEIRKYEADEDFRNHLRIYKQQNNIAVADYPQILLATPAESDFINENYVLKNPVGNGATSVVYAAFDRRNGDAVAIKKIRRTNDNAPHIQQDLIIADHIGKHVGTSIVA